MLVRILESSFDSYSLIVKFIFFITFAFIFSPKGDECPLFLSGIISDLRSHINILIKNNREFFATVGVHDEQIVCWILIYFEYCI